MNCQMSQIINKCRNYYYKKLESKSSSSGAKFVSLKHLKFLFVTVLFSHKNSTEERSYRPREDTQGKP